MSSRPENPLKWVLVANVLQTTQTAEVGAKHWPAGGGEERGGKLWEAEEGLFFPLFLRVLLKDFLAVQWLRLHAPNAGGLDLVPGQGTRSHMLQLKIPRAALKIEDPVCRR